MRGCFNADAIKSSDYPWSSGGEFESINRRAPVSVRLLAESCKSVCLFYLVLESACLASVLHSYESSAGRRERERDKTLFNNGLVQLGGRRP